MRFFRSLRDEQGVQTLEWVALALVILALIGGGAYFLARPSRGVGESVTDVITAMFSCLADEKACGLGETGMAKGARCLAEPLACPGQIFSCVVYRSCRGDEPWMVVGLMPWVAGLLLPVLYMLYIFFISAKGGGVPQALPRTSKPWWKIAGNMIFEWLDEAVSIFQGVRDAWKLHHLKFVKRPQKFISVRVNTPPGTRIAYRVRVKKMGFNFTGTRYKVTTVGWRTFKGLLKNALSKGALLINMGVSVVQNLWFFGTNPEEGATFWDRTIRNPRFWISTAVDFGLAVATGVAAAAIVGGIAAGAAAMGVATPLWVAVFATAMVGVGLGWGLDRMGVPDKIKKWINHKILGR